LSLIDPNMPLIVEHVDEPEIPAGKKPSVDAALKRNAC